MSDLIDDGDTTCAEHLEMREQNLDFEGFGRSLVRRPRLTEGRDLKQLVSNIDVPVYLTGAWQDEQTGPQFADMLGDFTNAPVTRFTMFNGRHPDGYSPLVLTRWYEFLEFYVHEEVPRLSDGIRAAAGPLLSEEFGVDGLGFEPDRFPDFADDDLKGARAAYEAEDPVRVIFENGAGGDDPGAPVGTYDVTYDAWPPADTEETVLYLGDDGELTDAAPDETAVDRFANDPQSAKIDFFGEGGYPLLAPTWNFDWTHFAEGDAVSYETAPFDTDTVLGGPGYAQLFMRIPDDDANVQVTLTLIDAEDTEWLVTTGLLRLSDRKVDEDLSSGLYVDRSFAAGDAMEMPAGAFEPAKISLPSFAQTFRAGDRLRITISSPGRNFGAWLFETIGEDGAARDVGRGPGQASAVHLGVLPDIGDVPDLVAECPSLRGQACRPAQPRKNAPAE